MLIGTVQILCTIHWLREGVTPIIHTRHISRGTGAHAVLRFKEDEGSFSRSGSNVND